MQSTQGTRRAYFALRRAIFQVKCASASAGGTEGLIAGRCSALISSAIRVKRREIETQLLVGMIVLDTAADAIISCAVNQQSIG
jgi:hypothetical protein